ncbi:MAG: thrombospondin type 3 repeat-containing protein [Candidatus Magasanikbacteria bacterium]|nr:thrombospondin type 3 repeat-containing protein [Candidatus Magasanikbacteria bacterium]
MYGSFKFIHSKKERRMKWFGVLFMILIAIFSCDKLELPELATERPELPEQFREYPSSDITAEIYKLFNCGDFYGETDWKPEDVVCDGVVDCPSGNDEIEDICHDADEDGIPAFFDNCSGKYNPGQDDLDGDGFGDTCDMDMDGDERENYWDPCPMKPLSEDEICMSEVLIWCYPEDSPAQFGYAKHISRGKFVYTEHPDVPLKYGVQPNFKCARILVDYSLTEVFIGATSGSLTTFTQDFEPEWLGKLEPPTLVFVSREIWAFPIPFPFGMYNEMMHGFSVQI